MVVEEFIKLASIDSVSKKEGQLAEYLRERLTQLGCEVIVDDSMSRTGSDTGNLLARFPGNDQGKPAVLLAAHMDTVGSTAGMIPEIRDGILYSNGQTVLGADDKAGIAVILTVLERLGKQPQLLRGDLEILFTVQEEVGLIGVKNFKEELHSTYGYVLDADGPVGTIVNEAPSHVTLSLYMRGQAAHAGVEPERGRSAIVAAAKAIASLPSGKLDEETTSNFGTIHGGTARNVVPEAVVIEAEVRSRNKKTLEREVARMLDVFTRTAEETGTVFSAEQLLEYESFVIAPEHPLLVKAREAAELLGIEVQIRPTGGGMDANILYAKGLSCVALGLGTKDMHSVDESIAVEQLCQATAYLEKILLLQ